MLFRKTLKWTGILLLALVAGVALVTALMQYRTFDAPYPGIRASKDPAVIARGKHLALGPAHCVDCHSPIRNRDSLQQLGKEAPLQGGFTFEFPLGKFYSANITPDKTTGIGRFTDGELARVLRYGVKANGEAALPFMAFKDMSDEDITAIISYLRSLEPVHNPVPKHQYSVMGRIVKAFLLQPEGPTAPIAREVRKDTTAAYGRYLVMTVANCNGCHTKHDGAGKEAGARLAGGVVFAEPGKPTLVTPNLTPHPTGRLYGWSQADFIRRFRKGRLVEHSHMPWESYRNMSDEELKAIYHFLRSTRPAPTVVEPITQ